MTEACPRFREATAIALWKYRGDATAIEKIFDGSDDKQDVLIHQACLVNGMLSILTGHTAPEGFGFDTNLTQKISDVPALADQGPAIIAEAHLASAVVIWPAMASLFTDKLAEGAVGPLAWLANSVACSLAGDYERGGKLLEQMTHAPDLEAVCKLILNAHASR